MALHWKWDSKIGEMMLWSNGKEFTVDLYEGNAYLICISTYEENDGTHYSLYTFFDDEEHMKNCLGISKGYDSIFTKDSSYPIKLSLNSKSSYRFKIIQAFTKWAIKNKTHLSIDII